MVRARPTQAATHRGCGGPMCRRVCACPAERSASSSTTNARPSGDATSPRSPPNTSSSEWPSGRAVYTLRHEWSALFNTRGRARFVSTFATLT
eukprot:m.558115 g.558115  ORF g.558115 m.558115 type:complete len:93 (-) comp22197_c0_seq4:4051-4329(-)